MPLKRLAATVVLAALVLAGCGGKDPEPKAAEPSSPAATGPLQTADAFTFRAPEGWKSGDESQAPSINFEALAIDKEHRNGFSDNVNVLQEPALVRYDNLDDRVAAAKKGLASLQPKNLTVESPVRIDGENAAALSADAQQDAVKYVILQYYVVHAKKGYVITFSYSPSRSAEKRREIAESVAASWKWTS